MLCFHVKGKRATLFSTVLGGFEQFQSEVLFAKVNMNQNQGFSPTLYPFIL